MHPDIPPTSGDPARTVLRMAQVGFDGAAFQSKINALAHTVGKQVQSVEPLDQPVIEARVELPAPAGEAEIEQAEGRILAQGDRAGVAQPGVVVGKRDEGDPAHVDARGRQARAGVGLDVVVRDADQDRFEPGDRRDQGDVGVFDLTEALGTVGVGMWPRNQDRGLGLPLRGEAQDIVVHRIPSGRAASVRFLLGRPCWPPRRSPCSSRSTR